MRNRRNALGTELMHAFAEAFAELDRDDGIAALVISATAPGFCAGSDLKELATMDIAQMCAHEAETARVVRAIGFLEKPAVAAVSGFALGGGVGLAVGCDLIVTHPNAAGTCRRFRTAGCHPGRWHRSARGSDRLRRGVWCGRASRSREPKPTISKLADYLVPLADVESEAVALAERLAALPRVAVASTKRFFTPLINGDAEASDMLANRIFAENCQDEASRATLRKFGMKV